MPTIDRATWGTWAEPSPPPAPAPVPALQRALPWIGIVGFLALLIAGWLILGRYGGGTPEAGAHFHSVLRG